ncbi:TIGR00266 family protein [Crocosphaera sp. XPORK-15E]|uniref:TIGR00266 family protein n=1 Tax=Crocosphaera sp. XPORK-15E TaxID=3110247 RepID=UPI002B201DD4|nr:TIGR00266 family protein [Crocosphaera sp. XPORK-15E]MEA5533175.1 TIGR00266 family protein [Crocosphaera sp. XPORK-15E]
MKVEILHERENSLARVMLDNDEVLMAQGGTLVALKGNISLNTTLRRSSRKSDRRNQDAIATESLFITEFRAMGEQNEVWLAPSMMGNILLHEVTSYKLIALVSNYLASSGTMDLFFGLPEVTLPRKNETLTLLSITGQGEVLINGLGGIYLITVDGEYLVNLAHLVAFENSLKYEITQLSKKGIGSWFKQQPLFMKFTGQGKLYCQTHHAKTWGHLIASRLKSK